VLGGAIALALLAAVLSQLLLPSLIEDEIEQRLTAEGGSAAASVSAFPAARLLVNDGGSVLVSGDDLDFPLDEEIDSGAFDRLDGFERVEIELADFTAGPFAIDSLSLRREGEGPYELDSSGQTDARQLARYGADFLDVPGAGLLGFLPGDLGTEPVPIELDMELASEDGRIVVTSGESRIAGFSTGPLAQLITAAIVVRL